MKMKLHGSMNSVACAAALTFASLSPANAQLSSQLGILDVNANGGINPNTGLAWQAGDQYRLAFYSADTRDASSADPAVYNAWVTSQANQPGGPGGTWTAMLSTVTTNVIANTGTAHAGDASQGGAGVPVYAMDGTTAIARNYADLWNGWSSPFGNAYGGAADTVVRIPSGSGPVPASQNVHFSPFLDQFGAGDSQDVHGVNVWTGTNPGGVTHPTQPAGSTVGTPAGSTGTTQWGSSNANNPGRIWQRGNSNNVTTNLHIYAISDPLSIVDDSDTTPPTLDPMDIVDDKTGGPVLELEVVTYTVTFSETMNASSVEATDFENASATAITVDSVSATADGAVFEVVVTPTEAGTLQLQVKQGAALTDAAGNPLDTATAIADDTIITVDADNVAPTLAPSDIVDNIPGDAVVENESVTYTVTFSKPMDPATVEATDFENASLTAVTIDSVNATADPAIFEVVVTVTEVGMLQLQVAAGATLTDVLGNPLDTVAAIADDTIITVNAPSDLVGQLGVWSPAANGGANPATGLAWAVGDQYRLAFYTSQKRDAESTDIADYNTFVQGVAASSTAFPDLGNGTWKVLGSTQAVSARQNTGTETNDGIPMFVLDGVTSIANDSDDMWNGFSDPGGNVVRTGTVVYSPYLDENGGGDSGVNHGVPIATGTSPGGSQQGEQYLGTLGTINVGASNANNSARVWNRFGAAPDGEYSFYALSEPLTVIPGGQQPPFAITDIIYDPDADKVTLTWRKSGAEFYGVYYSRDLINWGTDLDDNISAADDENPDDAGSITMTFDLVVAGLAAEEDLFFRVQEE